MGLLSLAFSPHSDKGSPAPSGTLTHTNATSLAREKLLVLLSTEFELHAPPTSDTAIAPSESLERTPEVQNCAAMITAPTPRG